MMKKHFLFALWILIPSFFSGLFAQEMTYSKLRNGNGISINMELNSYAVSSLHYRGEQMHEVTIPGVFIPSDAGMPNLPRVSRFVAVPTGAEVRVSIKNMTLETLDNINIAPAIKLQPITEMPVTDYVKNDNVYNANAYYPQNICEVSEVTALRGVNAVVIGIAPFQFNPVTQKLNVIQSIEVEVEFVGGTTDYGNPKYRSSWFDPILQNALLNYEDLPEMEYRGKSSKDGNGCEYLIVIPNRSDFEPLAAQIKEFRTKQGIYTKVMRMDEMGAANATQLKEYLHNAYKTWAIPPVAVLLMGDHNLDLSLGVPAEIIPHTVAPSCATDNRFADPNGDNLPDMIISRMSAETLADMNVLVSKVIEYETQPCMQPSFYQNPITALGWQTERWFQVTGEAIGGYWRKQGKTPVRINELCYPPQELSTWSYAQNTDQLLNYFGTNGTGYLPNSPSTLGNWTGGTAEKITNAVNSGAFFLQHCDHGDVTEMIEPHFTRDDVSTLQNTGKMTYLFLDNCLSGKFNYATPCFGETFHRHTYNGQNAGCVGFIGATETSFSFVADAFIFGVYDLFDPAFMPTYGSQPPQAASFSGNWMPAFGNVAGKHFLFQSNWPTNPNDKTLTCHIFTAHSDAFLRLFTEVPQPVNALHDPVVFPGMTNFWISAEKGALIALTAMVNGNMEILDVATATGEMQTMTIPNNLLPNTEFKVVCTGQNFLRYESVVQVVDANRPFLVGSSYKLSENADFGKTVAIKFDLKNEAAGIYTAKNVKVDVETASQYVTFPVMPVLIGDIEAGALYSSTNDLLVAIAENAPDHELVVLKLKVTYEYGTEKYDFSTTFNFKTHAPTLDIKEIYIENMSGVRLNQFNANASQNVVVVLENNGSADLHNINAALSITSEYLEIEANATVVTTLGKENTAIVKFLTKAGSAPAGTPASVVLRASSEIFMNAKIYTSTIGAASSYYMGNETLTLNSANFYDTGGPNNSYSANENLKITFLPANADKKLKISFSAFDVEANNDNLSVYNGTTSSSSLLLATLTGSELPQDYEATNSEGALTFVFKSNASTQNAGWAAMIYETEKYHNVSFVITDENNQPVTGATIVFDGYILAKNQLNVSLVASGTYTYSVAKTGYPTVYGTVKVENGDKEVPVKLSLSSIKNNSLCNFYAYPNPFGDIIHIEGDAAMVNKVFIDNFMGQRIATIDLQGKTSFSTAHIPAGIYFITFERDDHKRETMKMIKQ